MLEMKLGIAGTAKNTGKTTATAAVISELRSRGIPFYLTSIGFDGEDMDNVTGLPKPKLRVEPGDVVATAEKCLKASTAVFSVLHETNVRTPLGRIVVARVEKAGLAVTAGPNKSGEIGEIAGILSRFGPGITLFDGALNRIAPMVETDGFILATGAARTPDIPRLAQETEHIWRIANLPTVPQALGLVERRPGTVTLFDEDLNVLAHWPGASLLSERDAALAVNAAAADGGAYLYVPGIIGERAFAYLAEQAGKLPPRLFLTLADPIKLLAFANPVAHYHWIEQLERHRILTGVIKRVPLLAVTLNPFFPEFRYETSTYHPAFIDPIRLQISVSEQVDVPVYNVVRQGVRGLVDTVLANARTWETPMTTTF
jgi:hypothetical protein